MDQVQKFQSVAMAYYSIIEVVALCLLLLYEFFSYVNPATPLSQTFPLQDFFIVMLILTMVGSGLLNMYTLITKNMLLGVTLVSNYMPGKSHIYRKSILLVVSSHASLLIINLLLLLFLPANSTILLLLVILGMLLIFFIKRLLGKKQVFETSSITTCIHCHGPIQQKQYPDNYTRIVDHCRTCSDTEHRISHVATVDLLVRPIALLLVLYTVLLIVQVSMSLTKTVAGPNSIIYIITEIMVLISLYVYILIVYIVYPLLTVRKLRLLKKYPNFGLVNIIQGASKKNTTIHSIMYIEFMITYMLLCIPVVGLVALLVITGLAQMIKIFPTISLKELLNRTIPNHSCHLGSIRVYIM